MKNFKSRLSYLEKVHNVNNDVLVIIVNKSDVTCEAAIERVIAEKNINKLPTDCHLFIINTLGKFANN